MLEALIPFEREISVLVARGADGNTPCGQCRRTSTSAAFSTSPSLPARIDGTRLARGRKPGPPVGICRARTMWACSASDVRHRRRLAAERNRAATTHNGGHYTIRPALPHSLGSRPGFLAQAPLGDTRWCSRP